MTRPSMEPCDATLGAVVREFRLAELNDDHWRAIEDAFHEFAVLIFPGQHLRAEDQVAFGRRFGEIEHLYGTSGHIPISNQCKDGSLLDDEDPAMQIMRGNEGWHTDSSYMKLAAKASMLSAQVVPASGGGTEWADMRDAYDSLEAVVRGRIHDLSAYHSLRHSQAQIGHTDAGKLTYGFAEGEPPLRPLVKVHPVTRRPALYIGRHAYGIPGISECESESLLRDLLDFACQPPRILQHDWAPGDLVVWDNRCALHRARPYDHLEARVLRHTRIAGDPASEMAANLESGND
jgi:alpha-ketoglutarate-dependent taurine dioxygenase